MRRAYWSRRLRPILPGPEPLIRAQIDQRYRGTIVVSALILAIGLVILSVFSAFGRGDIGLQLMGLECLPAGVLCWLDFRGLRNRALAYLRELGDGDDETPPGP